jgi:catechol-2,3-dioxygenase
MSANENNQKGKEAMHIEELTLHTRHLADQKTFYHTLLGLPLLSEAADSFTIQAGTTHLRFQQTELNVLYHLAFSIPGTAFQD